MLFREQRTNIFLCNSHKSHSLSMCERSENEVVPISQLFNCAAEVELRFHIASQKNYSRVQALVQQYCRP